MTNPPPPADRGRAECLTKVLIIDPDAAKNRTAKTYLKSAGCCVSLAKSGADGLQKALTSSPDVILLELALPDMDGLDICKALREDPAFSPVPIIIVSERSGEVDRILGLECGADDYLTKPFNPRELVLRMRNALPRRRANDTEEGTLTFGELKIDVPRHNVTVGGQPVALTFTEFRLLTTLAAHKGQVQSRRKLVEEVTDRWDVEESRAVDTHMRRLRRKLGTSARFLRTVYRVGYRFVDNFGS